MPGLKRLPGLTSWLVPDRQQPNKMYAYMCVNNAYIHPYVCTYIHLNRCYGLVRVSSAAAHANVCVFVCTIACIHTHIHTYIHTYIHAYTHTYI